MEKKSEFFVKGNAIFVREPGEFEKEGERSVSTAGKKRRKIELSVYFVVSLSSSLLVFRSRHKGSLQHPRPTASLLRHEGSWHHPRRTPCLLCFLSLTSDSVSAH